jgi:hypothetical protein
MNDLHPLFNLQPDRWFAWQMIPGYLGERCVPWASPIYMTKVTPLKQGQGILNLSFDCPLYAEGVTHFERLIQVLIRAENYLVGLIVDDSPAHAKRCVVISHIEFEWIRRFCPDFYYQRPPTDFSSLEKGSVSFYLDAVFRPTAHQQKLNS